MEDTIESNKSEVLELNRQNSVDDHVDSLAVEDLVDDLIAMSSLNLILPKVKMMPLIRVNQKMPQKVEKMKILKVKKMTPLKVEMRMPLKVKMRIEDAPESEDEKTPESEENKNSDGAEVLEDDVGESDSESEMEDWKKSLISRLNHTTS